MMEGHKATWILEFVLRQPIEDWLAKAILLRLPLPPALDPRLFKTLLLRRLSSSHLSPRTLHSLELLEELHRPLAPSPASDALRAAYAAVAAELTAAPLRSGRWDDFVEAVGSVWERRVSDLERSEARGLVGEGLREWRRRLGEAVASEAGRRWVLGRDTKGEAVRAVEEYVRVALEEMGPPLLELAAMAMVGKPDGGGGRAPGVSAELGAATGAASVELAQMGRPAPGTDAAGVPHVPEIESCKQRVLAGHTSPAGQDKLSRELGFSPMLEINKVKEALKSSCADLQKAVEDPLPNALLRASDILHSLLEKSADPHDADNGQNQKDVSAPEPSIQRDPQATLAERAAAQDHNGIPHPAKLRPSLMDPNPTARTLEWDEDSIEVSSVKSQNSSKRPHLSTPRNQRLSPLQHQETKKIVRRRKIKRWTPEEEEALREAVRKHGKGNWKFILQCYCGKFEDRTEVDLKDKWRNLIK